MKNVYHDLSTSPFSYKVDDFLFIFSSKLYLDKFFEDEFEMENGEAHLYLYLNDKMVVEI